MEISKWNPGNELNEQLRSNFQLENIQLENAFDSRFAPSENAQHALFLASTVFGDKRLWMIKFDGESDAVKNITCVAYPHLGDWETSAKGIGENMQEAICHAVCNIKVV